MASDSSSSESDPFNLRLYKKRKCLGKGTFGTVHEWKLKDKSNSDRYPLWIAVKEIIPPEANQGQAVGQESKDKEEREKHVRREHMFMQKYPHKNIVSYLGQIDKRKYGVTYFIMELCTTDLKRFRKGRILSFPEVSVIMKQVLTALEYLHGNNIIHRDIKPGNILVKCEQPYTDLKTVHLSKLTFMLCDFGLARYMYKQADSTMTLSTVGTYDYVPPEARDNFLNKKSTGHYTASFDTFAAGVVTFELITGKLNPDVATYTNFGQLQTSLGHNCDYATLDFLQSMLHANKTDRKSPAELLLHSFIKQGELYLQVEKENEEALQSSLDKTKQLTQELKKANVDLAQQEDIQARMERTHSQNMTEQKSIVTNIEQIKDELSQQNQNLKIKLEESNRARMVSEEELNNLKVKHESETKTLKQELEFVREQLINAIEYVAPPPVPRRQIRPSENTGARSKIVATVQPSQQQYQQASSSRSSSISSLLNTSFNSGAEPNTESPSHGRIRVERNLSEQDQKTVNEQLWKASEKGDIESLKVALKQGAQPNYYKRYFFGDSRTSLHEAVNNGHYEATALLLTEGADVDAVLGDQSTALILASWRNHPQVVKLLLEHGALVNMKESWYGYTALHRAADWANLSCVQLLVEVGRADVNVRDKDRETPLAKAERRYWGNKEDYDAVIKYLMENGATK